MKKASRPTQRQIGKYLLKSRLGEGGFGTVWRALDQVEGLAVAVKIPFPQFSDETSLEGFRHEAKVLASLDHPHILRIKNAEKIDQRFLIVSELGKGTLAKKMKRRLPLKKALGFFEQMLSALAFAHEKRVIHRDIKPENFIVFGKDQLRLADFGVARLLEDKHLTATVSGTLGFMAPEQAYGRPTKASDVFSAGLILYAMITGKTPAWPFDWPFRGIDILRKKVPRALEQFIQKSCAFRPQHRFKDAIAMQKAFAPIHALCEKPKPVGARKRKKKKSQWNDLRKKEFLRAHKKQFDLRQQCCKCQGPMSETFAFCPWCRQSKHDFRDAQKHHRHCSRCRRHLSPDWHYCPWCFGPKLKNPDPRFRNDARYTKACKRKTCDRKLLLPFMRYCPWCNLKVKRPWQQKGFASCKKCHWVISQKDWDFCPWCGVTL